jgi:hypothetical protein
MDKSTLNSFAFTPFRPTMNAASSERFHKFWRPISAIFGGILRCSSGTDQQGKTIEMHRTAGADGTTYEMHRSAGAAQISLELVSPCLMKPLPEI